MFNLSRKLSRLEQWDGRRRSSRGDQPLIPRLFKLTVLARLATVLITMVAVTLLACAWGPPPPYRVGQVHSADLRARTDFTIPVGTTRQFSERDRRSGDLDATGTNAKETSAPTSQGQRLVNNYSTGMILVRHDQPITFNQLLLLEAEHCAFLKSLPPRGHVRRGVALFLVMSLLAALVVVYSARFQQSLAQSWAKIAGVCALVVLTMAACLLVSGPPWHAVLLPLTLSAMILTIAYNAQFALLMSVSLSLAACVSLDYGLEQFLEQMGGLATAVLMLRNVRTRTRPVQVGVTAGFAYAAMTVAAGLLSQQTATFMTIEASRHLILGSLAGFILAGGLPAIERSFGVITDVSLLELGDGSHPLLQELVRRAPGTHTHSMTVAVLAEAAAEAIGANPLLARIGSYFHDIGKMLKPQYFVENQAGANRHEGLEPALSALVIIGHIKDGLALARQYRLPRPVVDFVQQHHGTTLVEYFYREAVRLHEVNGQDAAELECNFRYPGPKPQNRENAIVMLADAVESCGRALHEPSPGSLQKLVNELVMKRLLDGQFEESGLTLTELHLIEDSLAKGLIALHHARIKYPDDPGSDEKEKRLAS